MSGNFTWTFGATKRKKERKQKQPTKKQDIPNSIWSVFFLDKKLAKDQHHVGLSRIVSKPTKKIWIKSLLISIRLKKKESWTNPLEGSNSQTKGQK